jgi:tryptophan-rich sensory protein
MSNDDATRAFRRAAAVTGLGLLVQLAASFHWTPITFVVSAAVGVPLVLLGAGLFLRTVLRFMKSKGAF